MTDGEETAVASITLFKVTQIYSWEDTSRIFKQLTAAWLAKKLETNYLPVLYFCDHINCDAISIKVWKKRTIKFY